MKKNRDYSRSKGRFGDWFHRKKSNRDYVIDDKKVRAGQAEEADGADGQGGFKEVERTPRTDLSRVEKVESIFVPKFGRKLQTNRYMLYTSFIVLFLFAGLIVYMVWFTSREAARVITNPRNKRSASMQEYIRRGSIKSANDKILAETRVDDEGHEYRSYPYDDYFAHVVGYASHGRSGLESACNFELLTSHESLVDQFKQGITGKKNTGDTIRSTLDTRLQKRAYEALGDNKGAIVAIEPKTGKVRAMVSKPDFNPNTLDEDWQDINVEGSSRLVNRALSGMYPPGSTYKLLTALEYIEEHPGDYQNFSYKCKGKTVVNSVKINCYGNNSHGKEDLTEAFAHSCNTAFVTMGSKLELRRFIKLNQKFLFDSEIPFDLPVKQSRFGLNADSDKSDIPQVVIGQGHTLLTPFHNALIMCAIANDGMLMRPTLIDGIESVDGNKVSQTEAKEWKRLADESDARIMGQLLRSVVTDGTGHALDTDQYTAAGKTGTAENGSGEDHSWFVGYSNIDNPDLVVAVIIENGGAGSEVAAPAAAEIFDCYYSNELYKQYR